MSREDTGQADLEKLREAGEATEDPAIARRLKATADALQRIADRHAADDHQT